MKLRPIKDTEIPRLNLKGIEIVPQKSNENGYLVRDTITGTYLIFESTRYGQPAIYANLPIEIEIEDPAPGSAPISEQDPL